MPLSTTSTCILNTSRGGDSTISLGSQFQCLTTVAVKKCLLISNLVSSTSKGVPVCYLVCIGWDLENCWLRNQKEGTKDHVCPPCSVFSNMFQRRCKVGDLQFVHQDCSIALGSLLLHFLCLCCCYGTCLDWFSASVFNCLFLFLFPRRRWNHWFILRHTWRFLWVPFANIWWVN